MVTIGIDFGTDFSSVSARLEDGLVHALMDRGGQTEISSCVSFLDNEIRTGNQADLKRESNMKNTIYDFKLLLGVTSDIARSLKMKYGWPFQLTEDKNGKVQVEVQYKKKSHQFYPEEIVAMLFRHLIEVAEMSLNHQNVCGAVITVSSVFNHAKRKGILDAAKIAGIRVEGLLNKTTAAAISYSSLYADQEHLTQRVVVIHVGSGSTAVSLCHIKGLSVKVLRTEGRLTGGKDVNINICKALEISGETLSIYPDLIKLIEKMKKDFCWTEISERKIEIRNKIKKLSKSRFNEACHKLVDIIADAIVKVVEKTKVDKFLMVGGSARLSLVHQVVESHAKRFNATLETAYVKTDEMVVLGAGLIGSRVSFADYDAFKKDIDDISTYSIVITGGNELCKRGTRLADGAEISFFGPGICELRDGNKNRLLRVKTDFREKIQCSDILDRNGMISLLAPEKISVEDGISPDDIKKLIEIQRTLYKSNEDAELVMSARYELETAIYDLPDKLRTVLKRYEELRDGTMHISNLQPDVVRSIQKDIDDIPKMLKDACQVIKKGLSIHMIGQQENKHMVSKGKAEKKREKSSNNVAMAEKSKLKVSILELSNKLRTVLKKYEELEEYTSVISNLQLDDVRSIKDVVDRTLEDLCVIQQRIKVQLCNGVLGRDNGERSMQSEVSKNGSSSDVNTVGKRGSVGDHKVKLSQGSSSKRSDFEERSMQPDVSEIHLSNSISAVERDEPTEDNYRKSSKHSAIRHQDYDEIMAKEAAGLRSMSDNRHAATPPYAADIYDHTHPLHKSSPSERYHHQTNLPHCALDPINYRTQGGFTPQFTDPTTLTTSSHFHHTDPIESQPKSYRPMAGGRTHVHGSPHLGDQFQTYPSTCVDFHGTPSFPSSSPGHQQPGYDDFTHPNTTHHRAEGTKGSKSKGPSRGSSTRRY